MNSISCSKFIKPENSTKNTNNKVIASKSTFFKIVFEFPSSVGVGGKLAALSLDYFYSPYFITLLVRCMSTISL